MAVPGHTPVAVGGRRRLDVPPDCLRWREQGGSALNATWRLDAAGGAWFVKVNRADRLPMLEAEAAGLAELAACGALRVPRPLATGRDGSARLPGARVAGHRRRRARRGARPRARGAAPAHGTALRLAPRQHHRHDAAAQRLARRLGGVLRRPAGCARSSNGRGSDGFARAAQDAGARLADAVPRAARRAPPGALAAARRPVERQRRGARRPASRWSSTRPCTTAIAKPTSR